MPQNKIEFKKIAKIKLMIELKTKTKLQKTISAFLALTIILLLLFSCGKSEMPEIRTSGVVREDILDYGPNLFFPYRILFQYNRLTNTVTRLCPDPECNGNCPLDAFVDFPHFIDENNLYFTAIDVGFSKS